MGRCEYACLLAMLAIWPMTGPIDRASAQSYGGGWIEWTLDQQDSLILTHHIFVRHSTFWLQNDPFYEGDFEVGTLGDTGTNTPDLSYDWVWHSPNEINSAEGRRTYGEGLIDQRYAVGEMTYSGSLSDGIFYDYDICCRYDNVAEFNRRQPIRMAGIIPAEMVSLSPTVFSASEFRFPKVTGTDGSPGSEYGTLETDLFPAGTLLSSTPGIYTFAAGEETTVHTGIRVPETDTAGQALDWQFRFADKDSRFSADTPTGTGLYDGVPGGDIAGGGAQPELQINDDGSLTWAPTELGVYATQIIAYEQTYGTEFVFDFFVQVIDSPNLSEFYYTATEIPEIAESEAIPNAGTLLLMLLGLLGQIRPRWLAWRLPSLGFAR